MKMLGEFWYKELLPKHFTAQAGARYKFQMRTPKYMAEKLRKKGHQKYLVFSGDMERMVKSAATISATQKGVKVKMGAPRYLRGKLTMTRPPINANRVLKMLNRGASIQQWAKVLKTPSTPSTHIQPNKEEEIKMINEPEARDMAQKLHTWLADRINKWKAGNG